MKKSYATSVMASLRGGVAPKVGTDLVEVGLKGFWKGIEENTIRVCLDGGTGCILYVMGEYGRGKTFFCNYSRERLCEAGKGFVASHVDVTGFEALADYLGIYKEIVRSLQLPDSQKLGLATLLDEFVTATKADTVFRQFKEGTAIVPRVLTKISDYREFRLRDFEEGYVTALDWMCGERDIPATSLHLIREKGWSKLRTEDVDHYIHALKEIALYLGYEGLLVHIDEAEDRTSGFEEKTVREVLRNLKRIHNNLFQKDWFSGVVFVLAGTRDLWDKYQNLDEAQKQRMSILGFDLPILSKKQYTQLARKVIDTYDLAYNTSLGNRITETDIEAYLDAVLQKQPNPGAVTPRDFLSRLPDPQSALLSRLDVMRTEPEEGLVS